MLAQPSLQRFLFTHHVSELNGYPKLVQITGATFSRVAFDTANQVRSLCDAWDEPPILIQQIRGVRLTPPMMILFLFGPQTPNSSIVPNLVSTTTLLPPKTCRLAVILDQQDGRCISGGAIIIPLVYWTILCNLE